MSKLGECVVNCEVFGEGLPQTSVSKAEELSRKKPVFIRMGSIVFLLGKKEDHVLIPPIYCSCRDFKINSVMRKRRGNCYHIYAYCLSEKNGNITVIKDNDKEHVRIRVIITQLLKSGRSGLLRKILSESVKNL